MLEKVVKNQMKIEKKLIAFSILAITIGTASIVPLAFFMSTAIAHTPEEKPWFNLNITYATCSVSKLNSYDTAWFSFQDICTVNSDAVDSQVGGRLEYFRIQIYSDQGQIVNTTRYVAANFTESFDPALIHFARAGWFNTTGLGTFGTGFSGNLQDGIGGGSSHLGISDSDQPSDEYSGATAAQQIEYIRDAQTIYIDVHRIGYITCTGNSTVVTLANDEVIQHIELTKNGNQFVYGTEPPYWKQP